MSDLISRQAAIDFVGSMNLCDEISDDAYKKLTSYLDNLPSAQPERKTGKWIDLDCDEDKYDTIKCPCCKHTFTVDSYHWTDIGFVKDDFRFCPNCGAKMEKGE